MLGGRGVLIADCRSRVCACGGESVVRPMRRFANCKVEQAGEVARVVVAETMTKELRLGGVMMCGGHCWCSGVVVTWWVGRASFACHQICQRSGWRARVGIAEMQ